MSLAKKEEVILVWMRREASSIEIHLSSILSVTAVLGTLRYTQH